MPARKLVPRQLRRARACQGALASLLTAALALPAPAQLISIKTVPIAQGDQFDIFPSDNLGMAGLSIALADSLRDPFANPAKGSRLRGARIFGSPTFYSMSHNAGGGRSLPLGAVMRGRDWFGGVMVAAQEIDPSRQASRVSPISFAADVLPQQQETVDPALQRTGLQSGGNKYAFGMLGRAFPASRTSVGASLFVADLRAVDGVDLLYANSRSIDQSGHAVDLRAGVLKEWAGERALEAMLLHNRYGVTHDVTYADFFWDPNARRTSQRARIEHNLDRTNIWGAHLAYARPVAQGGWRLGGIATGNLMSHPKIPNYEIMNIPRDPGHSFAYNLGVGLSKRDSGGATFGVDAVYEPIWSNTWAEAEGPVSTAAGGTIGQGGKTIENHFRFSNATLRLGAAQDLLLNGREGGATLQLGLAVHSIHYWLDQRDNVLDAGRRGEERWVEWTPTWGATLRFPTLELRYRGRLTSGTGRPGVQSSGGFSVDDLARSSFSSNILAAPSGPLSLDPVRVFTHQLSVSLPIH